MRSPWKTWPAPWLERRPQHPRRPDPPVTTRPDKTHILSINPRLLRVEVVQAIASPPWSGVVVWKMGALDALQGGLYHTSGVGEGLAGGYSEGAHAWVDAIPSHNFTKLIDIWRVCW